MREIILMLGLLAVDLSPAVMSAQGRSAITPASSEITTDRPDVTESSLVVPLGSLQLENGITWTSGAGSSTVDFSQTLIRYSGFSRTEFRVGVPDFSHHVSGRQGRLGFGDLALGVKHQVGPLPGGFDVSIIAAVSLPSGSTHESSHGVDPFVKLPWSRDLFRAWSIGGQFSLFSLTEGGRRNTHVEPTFYAERKVGRRRDIFIEYSGDYHQRGAPGQLLHVGTAYRLSPQNQLDLHVGIGVSGASPPVFIGGGYSFRLDGLRKRRD